MAAHARSVLTGSALAIPIGGDRLLLGTWQGVFLWKHRTAGHTRSIIVTLVGD
jgi:secondary thiamine-phosphate synthase enzyme